MAETIDIAQSPRNHPGPFDSFAGLDELTTKVPQRVRAAYEAAPASLRIRILEGLLRPVGPLAIVTIAAGAFAHMLYRLRVHGVPVTVDDAARITPASVAELARYVAQASPATLQRILELISQDGLGVAGLAGSAMSMAATPAARHRRGHEGAVA